MKKKRYQSPTTQEVVSFVEAAIICNSETTFQGSTQGQDVDSDNDFDLDWGDGD